MKTNLLFLILSVLVLATAAMAEPAKIVDCCKPQPMGGMESLKHNLQYPTIAVLEKIEANVVLNFSVGQDGRVSDISVVQSGGAMFDQSAIEAVMATTWQPAKQAGYPVQVSYELPIAFRVK